MKGLYRLLNLESLRMLKVTGVIGIVLIGANGWLLRNEVVKLNEYSVIPRFEDIYRSSGGTVLFWISLIAVFTWYAISFYAHYWGSKSIYTLLTLPIARSSFHFAKLISLICGIALLLCAQFISTLLAYHIYESRVDSIGETFFMANGLFLALIRSEFFRLLFPLSLEGAMHGIVMWISLITMVHYAILFERSRNFWGIVPMAIAAYYLFKLIQVRMANPVMLPYESLTMDTLYSGILLLFSGYFVWHSSRWIHKGAIV